MAFPHPEDDEDDHIDRPDETPDKRHDIEEMGAVGIGDGTKSRLISLLIPTDDHEAEMRDGASDENGGDYHQGDPDQREGKDKIIRDQGMDLGWNESGEKKPLIDQRHPEPDNP